MGHALKEVFSVSQALALKQSLGVWEFFIAVPSRDARKFLSSEALSGPGLEDLYFNFLNPAKKSMQHQSAVVSEAVKNNPA
jgi:hypothetical protein